MDESFGKIFLTLKYQVDKYQKKLFLFILRNIGLPSEQTLKYISIRTHSCASSHYQIPMHFRSLTI
ncbi:hypothetical protein BpHYR1_042674 [Brachionus plicatilis]|uniref:Uncharacterized protein n=1 Tax=Brachionus plicatilis TaxID=10195 RepID=A0A3M7R2J3_BRAPC|nr:hypothetical protein BpHYR1_042674 [Brachionus plicatilis]